MIRLFGAILLILGGLGLGLAAVGHLTGRVRDLRELEGAIDDLQRELCWRMAPLPEALEQAAGSTSGRVARFLRLCAREASALEGRPFRQIWAECMTTARMELDREDAAILEELGAVLGRYDGDSQRQALERTAGLLQKQQGQAAERRERLGRLYGILGVSGGLLLVILLL